MQPAFVLHIWHCALPTVPVWDHDLRMVTKLADLKASTPHMYLGGEVLCSCQLDEALECKSARGAIFSTRGSGKRLQGYQGRAQGALQGVTICSCDIVLERHPRQAAPPCYSKQAPGCSTANTVPANQTLP